MAWPLLPQFYYCKKVYQIKREKISYLSNNLRNIPLDKYPFLS